jgi:hypothetical protein
LADAPVKPPYIAAHGRKRPTEGGPCYDIGRKVLREHRWPGWQYLTEKLGQDEPIKVPDINRAIGRAIVDVVMELDTDKHGEVIAAAVDGIGAYYLERRGPIDPAPPMH